METEAREMTNIEPGADLDAARVLPTYRHGEDQECQRADHGDHERPLAWSDSARIALVGMAAMAVWLRVWEPFPRLSVIGLVAAVVGSWPILKEAVGNLFERRMTMELSMSIAIAAALAIGEFLTALVIIFFVLIAEVLEELTVGRGRNAIQGLLDLLPRSATVRRDGATTEVNANQLRVGLSTASSCRVAHRWISPRSRVSRFRWRSSRARTSTQERSTSRVYWKCV